MGPFFNRLFEFLGGLFPGLPLQRRRLLVLIFILIIIGGFIILESQFHWLEFWFLGRKMALFSELTLFAEDDWRQNPELQKTYNEIVSDVSELRYLTIRELAFPYLKSVRFWKFVSAGLFGWIFVVSAIVLWLRGRDWQSLFFGALLIGCIFGIIGMLIPTIFNPWVNYLVIPVLSFFILFIYSRVTT